MTPDCLQLIRVDLLVTVRLITLKLRSNMRITIESILYILDMYHDAIPAHFDTMPNSVEVAEC